VRLSFQGEGERCPTKIGIFKIAISMLPEENNQPLHKYWKGKVIVKREAIVKSKNHIKAYKLRHEYTNYDQLINSINQQ